MRQDDYEIGFGKPPKRGQFRKGISGNPQGRPKGSRNIATVLDKALQEKIVVIDKGRRLTMTKLDASIKQLVDKAVSGDPIALRQMIALVCSTEDQLADPPNRQVTGTDLKVMRGILKRLEGCSKEDTIENE
jgi:hypothetical protein